jgi:hypothetical protein
MNPGDYIDTARKLVDALLDLVPEPVASQMLTDAAVRRANAKADAAEALKFGAREP